MVTRSCINYLLCILLNLETILSQNLPSIGIVGGGIGGSSCAYFLKIFWGDALDVTLFERDALGGRLGLVNVDGKYYESGGSVIHPRNKYMVDFVKKLGLQKKKPSIASRFGIYNGDQIVFEESDSYYITMSKFLWRYGFSGIQLWRDVKKMLDSFDWVYEFQRDEVAFTTVNQLMKFMDTTFLNMTQQTLFSELSGKISSKLLLEELVQSVMMVNYGQTNNISAFAGFVSLAGADDNLWSVNGGNKRVPEHLLQASKAFVINGDVQEIQLDSNNNYLVKYKEGDSKQLQKIFDIVILAAPLVRNSKNIVFKGFKNKENGKDLDFSKFERTYHRTIATFVKGTINPSYFNSESLPNDLLTPNPNLPFNSIGLISPVDDDQITPNQTKSKKDKTKSKKDKSKSNKKDETPKSNVYKVFSNRKLSADVLNNMFQDIQLMKQKEWLAYPEYYPSEPLPPFVLSPSLYYINAIEMAASAMEMSIIGAKNVALLAYDQWRNKFEDHTEDIVTKTGKEEL